MSNASTSGINPRHRLTALKNWDWFVVFGIVGMHIAAIFAFLPQYFSWSGLALCALFCWLTGGVGITLCYHRLLTHRSFTTPKWFEYFLTILGVLAWQGGPVQWVGVHRLHHAESDQELDPHSPKHGFDWAHMLWCMLKSPSGRDPKAAAKDLQRDPVIKLLDRYFFVPQFILMGAFYGLGYWIGGHNLGMSWFLWGVAVRTVFVYHGTWFVNSASHTWGYRNYATTDNSTNLWWVAILAYGEGWHNNHHAHQRSAAHGLRWWEFDLTWQVIKALRLVGLAKNIQLPAREDLPEGSIALPKPLGRNRSREEAQAIRAAVFSKSFSPDATVSSPPGGGHAEAGTDQTITSATASDKQANNVYVGTTAGAGDSDGLPGRGVPA